MAGGIRHHRLAERIRGLRLQLLRRSGRETLGLELCRWELRHSALCDWRQRGVLRTERLRLGAESSHARACQARLSWSLLRCTEWIGRGSKRRTVWLLLRLRLLRLKGHALLHKPTLLWRYALREELLLLLLRLRLLILWHMLLLSHGLLVLFDGFEEINQVRSWALNFGFG